MSLPHPAVKFALCLIHAFLPKLAGKTSAWIQVHMASLCCKGISDPPQENLCCRVPRSLLGRAEPPASLLQCSTPAHPIQELLARTNVQPCRKAAGDSTAVNLYSWGVILSMAISIPLLLSTGAPTFPLICLYSLHPPLAAGTVI